MKIFLFLLGFTIFTQEGKWLTNFEEAKKTATEKKQHILLNFSGSDWCGPCMRMKKEFFESAEFKNYSNEHLVLLNADFPRLKKNQLSKDQVSNNEKLADQYNPDGKFPYTLLLNANGNIIRKWEGLPGSNAADFVSQLKLINETSK